MKIRTILFGSIFTCILMLLVPNLSAIEFKTVSDNITDYNEDELINVIKERIEELKLQNPDLKISFDLDDPDGPFEGGLDDFYDWKDLFIGIMYSIGLIKMLKSHFLIQALVSGNIYSIVGWIFNYGSYTTFTLINFGDAFDIIDPDENGY